LSKGNPRSSPFSLTYQPPSEITGERIGNQRPTNCFIPEYTDTRDAEKCLRFLQLIGFGLDPWQEFVLAQMLGKRDDGTYSSKEFLLLVPRQAGKTRILEARALVGLYVLKEPLIVHTAQVFPTCRESYLRLKSVIDACGLSDEIGADKRATHFRAGNDNLSIEFEGRRILYKARGTNPIRGFSPQVIIADEAYAVDDEIAAAIENALSAQPNRQFICTSSTGLDDSDWLLRMRDRALAERGEHSLGLAEWCALPNCNLDDIEEYYRATPALGIRISLETVVGARRSQGDKQFGRERLGLWADNKFRCAIDLDLWDDLKDPNSKIVSKYVLAIDATPSPPHDSAIAIAGFNASGKSRLRLSRQVAAYLGSLRRLRSSIRVAGTHHRLEWWFRPGQPLGV
jgi:phage terminase large subunit-like protein